MRIAALFLLTIATMACQSNGTASSPTATKSGATGVVATVNGAPINGDALDQAAASQLKQVETQIYQIKKNALDDMIEDQLINDAAKKAGKSVDAFLKEEFGDKTKEPTVEEMKAFYEQRKAQIGNKTFEQVQDQIKQVMTQGKTQGARQDLLRKLRASADIKINLEPPRVKVSGGDNPSKGPANAPIQLLEWTDYQCPFCGRSRATINQILTTYGDKVRYTILDFPLSFHEHAFKAHEAAHCAGDQGKYWEMNQILFKDQQSLELPKLKEYARELKLNGDKFDKCLATDKYKEKVQKNTDAGSAVGVTGTPSFFINGINLSGARPFDDFKNIIDSELSKK